MLQRLVSEQQNHSPTVKPASAESTEHVDYLEFMIRELSVVCLRTMCSLFPQFSTDTHLCEMLELYTNI